MAGYLIAGLVYVSILVIINVRPGWRELPFVTEDLTGILWVVNLSLAFGAVVNVAYLWHDPAWFGSAGQIGESALGLAAEVCLLQVFPFDLSAYSFNWSALTRLFLVLAAVGSVVTIAVELTRLANLGISTR